MNVVDGVMRMQPVAGIVVPAEGGVTLRPGGLHIMFINIDAPFVQGERIPVTLHFERQGDVTVIFVSRPRTAGGAHHEH